ncbi:hypothetical protein HPB51_007032 [Rhipicephalus microplus]|uniref:Uncharacterized protein n=1 Tax=Rhipicephalus microplus TaxID=6941 RepID=A0A9J6DZ38_RHIMP|nr:hypothetical protein HPB51_007032 [Rhipicephalus microplus]
MHEQVTRASDVLETLNVSAAPLQSIQTQLQLFRFVILTSLRTGLPSVVSVKLRRNQLFLVSGRSLDLALKHGNTKEYLRETLKDMVFDHDDKIISDLLDIDASVTSRLIKANKSDLLVTRHLGDLSSPFANATWTDALNTTALAAELPALTAESLVLVRNEALVNAALGVLANAEFKCARLYAVVLLLAQVIRYVYCYNFTTAKRQLVEKPSNTLAMGNTHDGCRGDKVVTVHGCPPRVRSPPRRSLEAMFLRPANRSTSVHVK